MLVNLMGTSSCHKRSIHMLVISMGPSRISIHAGPAAGLLALLGDYMLGTAKHAFFQYMPHDPALPTTAAPVHVGWLVNFDNDVGRHVVVRNDGMRVFVGPIDRRFAIAAG